MHVCVKMYKSEKTRGLQRIILFIELFASLNRFGFLRPSSERMDF